MMLLSNSDLIRLGHLLLRLLRLHGAQVASQRDALWRGIADWAVHCGSRLPQRLIP